MKTPGLWGSGRGKCMSTKKVFAPLLMMVLLCVVERMAIAQSFRVQCPTSTSMHPVAANNNSEPVYNGATLYAPGPKGFLVPTSKVNGALKCQQISGGDGYATMG